MKIDFEKEPPYFKISDTHYAATWLLHPDAPKVEMPDILKHRIARMREEAGYEIGYAVTQQDKARNRGKKIQFTPVKTKAMELDIPVLQPERVKGDE